MKSEADYNQKAELPPAAYDPWVQDMSWDICELQCETNSNSNPNASLKQPPASVAPPGMTIPPNVAAIVSAAASPPSGTTFPSSIAAVVAAGGLGGMGLARSLSNMMQASSQRPTTMPTQAPHYDKGPPVDGYEEKKSKALLKWLEENEAMLTLCSTLAPTLRPVLMDITHDAVALTSINDGSTVKRARSEVRSSNARFRLLVKMLGGGDEKVGHTMLVQQMWYDMFSAAPGHLVSKSFSLYTVASPTFPVACKTHLECNVMKTLCGKQVVWAIHQAVQTPATMPSPVMRQMAPAPMPQGVPYMPQGAPHQLGKFGLHG